MPKRGDSPKPIKVTEPKDIPGPDVDLDPIMSVDEIEKPGMPDVSTSFLEEAWAAARVTLRKVVELGGVDINKLLNFPDTLYKLGILVLVVVISVVIPALIMNGC